MGDFFGSIWWLIVALGVLVSFHEFGHFWVARRCGVRVLRFSVGFGHPLWMRRGKDDTEYVVAAIPLGGYVKMLDEREGPVPSDQLDQAFNRKPLGQRTAIVAAGPVFNLILTLFLFWLMFMIGIPDIRAVMGETRGLAEAAGIASEDEIVAVEGAPTQTLTHATLELLPRALDRKDATVTLEDPEGRRREVRLELSRLPDDFREENLLEETGLIPWQPRLEASVGEVSDDSPAQRAGLQPGDRITAINGKALDDWRELGTLIQELTPDSPTLTLSVERDGRELTLPVEPERVDDEGGERYIIGISAPEVPESVREKARRFYTTFQYGPLEAMGQSFKESYRLTTTTLALLGRMITGSASLRNLSGPISIAQFANESAQLGVHQFLRFLGFLSLSLAILNFLPIPLLDGGHLMYYLIEWIKGSPVSDRTQIIGQYVGLLALAALMSVTFYNDILRLVS